MVGFFRATLKARSPGEAERLLRERYGDIALTGVGRYREHTVGDARFASSAVEFDGDFEVEGECRAVTVAVGSPGFRWRSRDEDGELSAAPAVFQPGMRVSSRLTGLSRVRTVTFGETALTDLADAVYGTPTALRFDGARPRDPAAGRAWLSVLRLARLAASLEQDLIRGTAFRALAVATLESFRLVGDRALRAVSAAAGLDAYRRACRFIDDHLSLPITDADVARAAGISERELRQVFAGHSPGDWTPREHLRRARLAEAHLELANADPTRGDTVTAIAHRWGFASPSAFAALHRAVYGVTPKWVLDR